MYVYKRHACTYVCMYVLFLNILEMRVFVILLSGRRGRRCIMSISGAGKSQGRVDVPLETTNARCLLLIVR